MILLVQCIVFIVGVALALYVALWHLFILSGVDIIVTVGEMARNGFENDMLMSLAWNIFKMVIAGVVGWAIMMVAIVFNSFLGEWK